MGHMYPQNLCFFLIYRPPVPKIDYTEVKKIKENQCPRRNFKVKEEEDEKEEEEEEEEICKLGCTFII